MEQRYLVDTNIFIYHFNGVQKAGKFIDDNFHKISISRITFLEILSFSFNSKREENIVRDFLKNFSIIEIDADISEEVILLRKKKKNKLPDAIIGATAKQNNFILVTRNEKDFLNTDIIILNPLK